MSEDAGEAVGTVESPAPPADPLRVAGHRVEFIPLHALDPAPFNPKKPIHGKYRRGLAANFDTFGNCDQLKVWPRPDRPGRYFVLDGNQRLDVLREQAEIHLIEAEFGRGFRPPGPGEVCDEETRRRLQELRSQATSRLVECRVLLDLDPGDAKLFTASFNRNHAVYDEPRLADLADELRHRSDSLVKRLLRPDRAFVAPPVPGKPGVAGTPAGPMQVGGPPVPGGAAVDEAPHDATAGAGGPAAAAAEDFGPWGPPPADAGRPEPASPAAAPRIPMVFSFSPDGYAAIAAGILRCKSRVLREDRIKMAVGLLAEREIDSALVELALRCVGLPTPEPAESAPDGRPAARPRRVLHHAHVCAGRLPPGRGHRLDRVQPETPTVNDIDLNVEPPPPVAAATGSPPAGAHLAGYIAFQWVKAVLPQLLGMLARLIVWKFGPQLTELVREVTPEIRENFDAETRRAIEDVLHEALVGDLDDRPAVGAPA